MYLRELLLATTEALLVTDVPREEWLRDKIAYAKKRGRNSFGVPYMGSTTGYIQHPFRVVLPVSILARIPGARGEQKNIRQEDLKAIMQIMKDTGKLPLTSSGQEYVPFISVAWNGEPWVMEGNHRIMAAERLGWETLPVELKYFDGGERVKSGLLYPGKIGLTDPAPGSSVTMDENFADGKKPGRKGLAKRMGVDCSQPVGKLRKIAANSSGERQRMAHWCANMKAGRSVSEGGWASTATQNTVITPALIDEVVKTLNTFANEFNQWQAKQGLDVEIKMGKPVGSGTYYKRDLAQDPNREYGDIDVMCYIHSREGVGSARRTSEYADAVKEFVKAHNKYDTDNGTNVIVDTSAGPVQVDLIYTYHEHANWARMLAPEYRVKGVINTSLVSSLAEVLNLSIGVHGVQVKTRNGQPVSFRQSKDTKLSTVSLDPENWGADVYAYYHQLARGSKPKQPANLSQHGGLKDEQRISDIILTIKALALDLDSAKLLGQGALSHIANKQDMLNQIAAVYKAKLDKVINSSKFDKAATPAAVEKAKKTKDMLAKYSNEVAMLLQK